MCHLEKMLINADSDTFAEICRTIDSSVDAGAPMPVLRQKLDEYADRNERCPVFSIAR